MRLVTIFGYANLTGHLNTILDQPSNPDGIRYGVTYLDLGGYHADVRLMDYDGLRQTTANIARNWLPGAIEA